MLACILQKETNGQREVTKVVVVVVACIDVFILESFS